MVMAILIKMMMSIFYFREKDRLLRTLNLIMAQSIAWPKNARLERQLTVKTQEIYNPGNYKRCKMKD
jgi:hypothetical protein